LFFICRKTKFAKISGGGIPAAGVLFAADQMENKCD